MSEPVPAEKAIPFAHPVALTSLSLHDLRNHASLSATLAGSLVVLAGPNGMGKTNLLEAISLLTPGRGLRRAAFDEITRHGSSGGWTVAAVVERNGEETRLGSGWPEPPRGEPRTRKVRINGATVTSPEALLDYLRILWVTPAMDGLFTGPAGERRRFLDRLVLTLDAAHARRTRDLDRLLTQRNRLLQDGGSASWLDAVEAQLAENAVAVASARAETVALLSRHISEHPARSFPAGSVVITGTFEEACAGRTASALELWYREALAEGRGADRAAGRTLLGPHRSDVAVTFAEKQMPAALSSTGEQKALLIGLVLGHAALVAEIAGMTPVLLLDEVAAHLDPDRRAALFDHLASLRSQVFMTGTDLALFADLPTGASRYLVSAGQLTPVH